MDKTTSFVIISRKDTLKDKLIFVDLLEENKV